ncbi:histidine kinase [Rhodococcus sp. IEGM 1379]|uniref:sensor histidine kinase n=1 Tax=Rhodococcus sp. IEGM 1379 TaxID=3047086 RepID=UPI0024B7BA8F|nr:histidine kinase [Rhodococcus sp. IEGM 1379]MDI9916833.1 histidine kinase [Rhodococcus sp. IEGM 1379]
MDALIPAMYGIFAVLLAVLSIEPPYVTPLWAMVALGLCGLAVLAWRRRYPLLAFVGAMVLSVLSLAVGSGAETILAVFAVYTAGVRRSALGAGLYFGVAMVFGALGAFALCIRGRIGPPILGVAPPPLPRDTLLDWANFYFVIAVALLIATLFGMNVGHRRRHIGELVDRAERLARERDQQAEIAKGLERERIAREMHDVIAHSLSVIIAISDGAHAAIGERPEEAKKAIARVAETGRSTLGEVRRLLGAVRGENGSAAAQYAPQPDASQLISLVAECVAAGLPVHLVVTGTPSVDPGLGLTVYRIVQESLTNVLRHARRVRSTTVTVAWMTDEVTILVRDVGSTVSSTSSGGRGIPGMRERVALYAGIIEAGPQEDGGWRVFARLRRGER